MNLAQVARVLAGFTVFYTLAQLLPLLLALQEGRNGRYDAVAGFGASIVVGALVAALLWQAGRRAEGQVFRKETIAVAGLAWVLAGVLGAIPFQWSGLLLNPFDAVFETVSGLTTCGGTVCGSGGNPAPEQIPHSLLFWRAFIQWIGGLGIVLMFVAMLPGKGMSMRNLVTSEAVAVVTDSSQPRALSQARSAMLVYLALTVGCTALLLPFGVSFFEALCQAFTCLATGGYTTRTSIADFHSLGVEVVLTVFMFLAGCNFAVMAASLRSGFRFAGGLLRTAEFKAYCAFTAVMVLGVTIDLASNGKALGPSLREASFNTVSMIVCCGFATADFQAWPPLSLILLFTSMIIGGCTGSTAGGFKQIRFVVSLKLLAYTIRHFIRPRSVERIKLDGEVLQASVISAVLAVVLLWLLTILLGAMVIAMDSRLSFIGAFTASASMLGCCGPAMTNIDPGSIAAALATQGTGALPFGPNIGPLGGYGDLHDWTKVVMSLEMILGRLELLTPLALLSPNFWRR